MMISKFQKYRSHQSLSKKIKTKRISSKRKYTEAVIVSAVRTPIGSFMGSLSSLTAPELGAVAIKGAIEKSGINFEDVDEVFMGNVLQAGIGQAPARQAVMKSGLPVKVVTTTVNKVCASGMKSVIFGAQSILLGDNDIVISGGMESMSNVPFYVMGARGGLKYGNGKLIDGVQHDGLWDVYNDFAMGMCAENCATNNNISRRDQDEYAIMSYQRAFEAAQKGYTKDEIIPVTIKGKKGDEIISEDDEIKKVNYEKIPSLKPVFKKDGTVTAANASKINDGASALVLMSAECAQQRNFVPLARIVAYADAETNPIDFTIAPSLALPLALKKAELKPEDIDLWEINEAFSVVGIVNQKLLNIDINKLNITGGGVSLGHPIGSSGAKIIATLVHNLIRNKKKFGAASICNGGGGASAIIIENLRLD
jgi:acetyl-CoA C-acetyltransferase